MDMRNLNLTDLPDFAGYISVSQAAYILCRGAGSVRSLAYSGQIDSILVILPDAVRPLLLVSAEDCHKRSQNVKLGRPLKHHHGKGV